jgi:hypothetical protein
MDYCVILKSNAVGMQYSWHPIFLSAAKYLNRVTMKISYAVGGLAGACALTLINQTVARFDREAPRLDLLGMNAAAKLVKAVQPVSPVVSGLLPMAVAGDLVSNSLYYSLAGAQSKGSTIMRGLLLGIGAGLGAVALPSKLWLNATPTNLTTKTKLLTIAYYMVGGLVAAAAINTMEKSRKQAL